METFDVNSINLAGSRAAAAVLALSLMSAGALAQQPAATAPATAAPAKVAPKVDVKPAVKAEVKTPVAPKAATTTAAAPSPCKGLDEVACKAKADVCGWIVPKKIDAKTGKPDNPYCRKIAGIAKKTPAAAAAPKVDAKTPAVAAPAKTDPAVKAKAPVAAPAAK